VFKRVPNGWVFTTPGLWPVGGATYLVNDAQKAALAESLKRCGNAIDRVFLVLVWICLIPGFVGVRSEMLGVILVGLVVALVVIRAPALQVFAIRPILAGAAAAPIRISFWDGLLAWPRSQAQTTSVLGLALGFVWLAVVTVLVWIGPPGSARGLPRHFSAGDYLYVLAIVFFTVHFGAALFLKLWEGRSQEPN
jgi:hypothetical protein